MSARSAAQLPGSSADRAASERRVGDAGPLLQMGWQFRGQAQVEALIKTITGGPITIISQTREHFANHTHLDINHTWTTEPLASGGRLLFGGCSAGGRGAMFTLDYLPALLPTGVELRGFLDSPLWVDVLPFEANITSLENQTQTMYGLVNPTARLGAECVAAYPGDEGWKCLYGQYRIPFVRTPFLMSASQFDLYQLPVRCRSPQNSPCVF